MATTKNKVTLFNPEQSPTVYDAQGHTVGGAERVTVDELDAVGQAAVDAGLLVREEPEPASKGEPSSKAADANATGASSQAKRA